MFEHFTSLACGFSQPLLFTSQQSTSIEIILIIFQCVVFVRSSLALSYQAQNMLKNENLMSFLYLILCYVRLKHAIEPHQESLQKFAEDLYLSRKFLFAS
jgi:hypothetical protein